MKDVTTGDTSWAPRIISPALRSGEPLYWRVGVDEGNSVAICEGRAAVVRDQKLSGADSPLRSLCVHRGERKVTCRPLAREEGNGHPELCSQARLA